MPSWCAAMLQRAAKQGFAKKKQTRALEMESLQQVDLNAFRSPCDTKNYRLFTLPNELEVLVIQRAPQGPKQPEEEPDSVDDDHHPSIGEEGDTEPSEDEIENDREEEGEGEEEGEVVGSHHAAACMSVGVGCMMDPEHVKGLAHYLEHMLFMGSEKYPDENAFEAFLNSHGGYCNGVTECEATRFLFEIDPQHLRHALDMFAQFFISPLFKQDSMERELLAIESEYNRAMQNDYVRLQQVQCETSAKDHPFRTFTWGNKETLETIPTANGINVREMMLQHFAKYYSSTTMKLVVLGEDSIEEMQKWIIESFSSIPKRNQEAAHHAIKSFANLPPPFGQLADQQPALIKIIPIRKMHSLHLYWMLPNLMDQYRQKPWEYVSHVLGDECKGSISDLLKEKHWATMVCAGISTQDAYEFGSFGSLFEVNIILTKKGLANYQQVVQMVFDYMRFLQQKPLERWIFDELKQSCQIAFRYQEELSAMTTCKSLSGLMQERYRVERKDLLQYQVIQGEFDLFQTQALLNWMTPQNTRVIILSHSFTSEEDQMQAERFIGVKYRMDAIEPAVLDAWRAFSRATTDKSMSLPQKNLFMPKSFELITVSPNEPNELLLPEDPPSLIYSNVTTKCWYKHDKTFKVPKTNVCFFLCLPSLGLDVSHYVSCKLYLRVVQDAFKQVVYQAFIANHELEMSLHDTTDLEFLFAGFSSTLHVFVEEVVSKLFDEQLTVSDDQFALVKDELLKELRNANLKPTVKARYMRLQLLEENTYSIEAMVKAVEEATLSNVISLWKGKIWQGAATLRILVHGNASMQEALGFVRTMEVPMARLVQSSNCGRACDAFPEPKTPFTPLRPQTIELPMTSSGVLLRDTSDHDEETNSSVEVYYQIGPHNFEDEAYCDVLQQIMGEPLFHQLRTKQQIGYEVYCCVRDTHGILGFSVAVQSASHATGQIALCIDSFMQDYFEKYLQRMDQTRFERHRVAVLRKTSQEPTTLHQQSCLLWAEIQSRRYAFDARQQLVKHLSSCTKDQLIERYHQWMMPTKPSATSDTVTSSTQDVAGTRKLRVHVVGQSSTKIPLETLLDEDEAPHIIHDLHEFKAELRCHL